MRLERLEKKVIGAKNVIEEALCRYAVEGLSVAWAGGKDSTLVLYLVKQVYEAQGIGLPKAFVIDLGNMFGEVRAFIATVSQLWGVDVEFIRNDDVLRAAGNRLGAMVNVSDLNGRNRSEIDRLGFAEDAFPFEPQSFVASHLMKTVPLNAYLEEERVQALFEGIRWDEQAMRVDEVYFSPREATSHSPEHVRIYPILHFVERDVWDAHFHYHIPFCRLYRDGYRSVGAGVSAQKQSDLSAWEQDLENTDESGGARQDKEKLMERLRQLGYI